MSNIDTAVVDGLKVLDPNGRLEKLPRGSMATAPVGESSAVSAMTLAHVRVI